jgi:hypothetical protein
MREEALHEIKMMHGGKHTNWWVFFSEREAALLQANPLPLSAPLVSYYMP